MTHSQPMAMHLACVMFKMSLNEALTAATLHAAHALRKAQAHGSIEPGKVADLVIVDAPRYAVIGLVDHWAQRARSILTSSLIVSVIFSENMISPSTSAVLSFISVQTVDDQCGSPQAEEGCQKSLQ